MYKLILYFFVFWASLTSVYAQLKQITILVKSDGVELDSVNVDIRTSSIRLIRGATDTNGEFSTSTIYSDDIRPLDNYSITCYKKGYETVTLKGILGSGSFNSGSDDFIFDFNLAPIPKKDPKFYATGNVFDRLDGKIIKNVKILVVTKKRKIRIETGEFGEFLIELSPEELLTENEVYIQLKRDGYADKQFPVNLTRLQSYNIYLDRLSSNNELIKDNSTVNYIPILGNFYRDENLAGWMYSAGLVASVGTIAYSSIQIPNYEQKAVEAVSDIGRENFLNKVERQENLRISALMFSGLVVGTSFIHCIINTKKKNNLTIDKDIQIKIDSEGLGLVISF